MGPQVNQDYSQHLDAKISIPFKLLIRTQYTCLDSIISPFSPTSFQSDISMADISVFNDKINSVIGKKKHTIEIFLPFNLPSKFGFVATLRPGWGNRKQPRLLKQEWICFLTFCSSSCWFCFTWRKKALKTANSFAVLQKRLDTSLKAVRAQASV